MNDDVFEDTDIDTMVGADFQKMAGKLFNDGYRIGKEAMDNKELQQGFDEGFERGMLIGKACGRLYAYVRYFHSVNSNCNDNSSLDTLRQIERILLEEIPEGSRSSESCMEELRVLVQVLSPELTPELEKFFTVLRANAELSMSID